MTERRLQNLYVIRTEPTHVMKLLYLVVIQIIMNIYMTMCIIISYQSLNLQTIITNHVLGLYDQPL